MSYILLLVVFKVVVTGRVALAMLAVSTSVIEFEKSIFRDLIMAKQATVQSPASALVNLILEDNNTKRGLF